MELFDTDKLDIGLSCFGHTLNSNLSLNFIFPQCVMARDCITLVCSLSLSCSKSMEPSQMVCGALVSLQTALGLCCLGFLDAICVMTGGSLITCRCIQRKSQCYCWQIWLNGFIIVTWAHRPQDETLIKTLKQRQALAWIDASEYLLLLTIQNILCYRNKQFPSVSP